MTLPRNPPTPPIQDNLEFWNALKRTDPKATKPFQRAGGFRGVQIDPAWRMQMMTEVFGPVGKGWGYEQLEWTIAERMVFICLRVWYVDKSDGQKYFTGPQWGGTEMVRKNRDGSERPDDESFKMSTTDALGKCMLQVGLAADVYLGQFDDSKYREESEVFYTIKSNPDFQPPAIEKFEADVREKLDACQSLDDIDDLWRSGINSRIREIGGVDKAAQNRMISAFSQKKNEIVKREESGGTPNQPVTHDHDDEEDENEEADGPDRSSLGAEVVPIQTPSPEVAELERWTIDELKKIPFTQKAFTTLWNEAEPKLNRIAQADQQSYSRIKGLYAQHQAKLRAKNGAPAGQVLEGKGERRQATR